MGPQPTRLDDIVRARLARTSEQVAKSLTHIANGNPLGAEPEAQRRLDRLQSKAFFSKAEAQLVANAIDSASRMEIAAEAKSAMAAGAEAIQGPTLDFVGVAFLTRGRRAASAVARVAFRSQRPQGSGFMVAPGLFLTNNHVIASPAAAAQFYLEFDYELDERGRQRHVTRFAFDPSACFASDSVEGLDYTLIAVGPHVDGPRALNDFGFMPLSEAGDKHMLGEVANVVQHPQGRFKELVLRENRLVARDETVEVLHYIADTESGSSGSPVFNNEWEPIALHHWGGPYHEVKTPDGRPLSLEINEGIRVSAIVRHLRASLTRLSGPTKEAVRNALDRWKTAPRPNDSDSDGEGVEHAASGPRDQAGSKTNPDGSVTFTFPIEINVRAPLLNRPPPPPPPEAENPAHRGAEAAAWWTKEDFSNRAGYEPGFVPGFSIPLPKVSGEKYRIAKLIEPADGDDPHELRYHHFSIIMNADRRLAFLTACNIDGARTKAVNRDDKTVITNPTLDDLGIESLGAEGAEASDAFSPDRRIPLDEQMTREFYEKQKVPGYPDPTSPDRIARMFQKGHIIMRGDPAWGSEDEAVRAERDTFFYTNAAPQLGFFNQGSALNRPGSKGKLRWRAVETYVLRNAVTMRKRIIVFAGPIFDDDEDPPYRQGVRLPMRFWKIAVWAQDDELRSLALIANQRPLLKKMPEAILSGAEAFEDSDELARVSEFISSVEEIENLTGINFGAAVRNADVKPEASGESEALLKLSPDDLKRKRPKRRARAAQRKVPPAAGNRRRR